MKMKRNNYYESPVIQEFETRLEGIICGSGGGPFGPSLPGHGGSGNQDAGGSEDEP